MSPLMAMMTRTQAVACRVLICNPEWINSPYMDGNNVNGPRRARYGWAPVTNIEPYKPVIASEGFIQRKFLSES